MRFGGTQTYSEKSLREEPHESGEDEAYVPKYDSEASDPAPGRCDSRMPYCESSQCTEQAKTGSKETSLNEPLSLVRHGRQTPHSAETLKQAK
jgi:hypothetical protein